MMQGYPEKEHTGGCLCGAVRYRVVGAPIGTNVCCCTQCQRQTGAPLPVLASYPLDRFVLLEGEPATFRSSGSAVRQFCGRCGSTLFFRGDGSDSLGIFVGTFDDPAAVPPPEYQIWTAHRAPWLPEMAGIPSYPGARTTPSARRS